MNYATVCSGIGAPECAFQSLGWHCQFQAEIEPFPSAVLKHHYPNTPNYGDITQFKSWPDHAIDLLVAGTPCQSFSVAGLRKGMADPRGNLAITFLAIVDRYAPAIVLWENVPGVLSSNGGRDFGSFLGGLAELGYGFAYRVLDAQYYGVAQRRRRVFVVGCTGGQWQRAASVLFERESLLGHPAPRRQTGEGLAPTISARPTGGGGLGTDFDCDGGCIPIQEIGKRQSGTPENGVGHGQPGDPMFTLQSTAVHGARLTKNYASHHGRTAGNNGGVAENQLLPVVMAHGQANAEQVSDGSPSLTCNHEAPIVFDTTQITSKGNYSQPKAGDPCHPIAESAHPPAIAFQPRIARNGRGDMGELVNALQAQSGQTGKGDAAPCVAFQPRFFTRDNKTGGAESCGEQTQALSANHGGGDSAPCVSQGYAVRRLTPRETERLQGFPDDWTLILYRGKPACDGPRYKAIGNSMAVPVLHWIGKQIQLIQNLNLK